MAIKQSANKRVVPKTKEPQRTMESAEAEIQLRETIESAQSILEYVTVPMFISRLSDGKILYANALVAAMVGIPLADLLQQNTPDFYLHDEDRALVVGWIQQEGGVNNHELELQRSNGEHFWVLFSARVFTYQNEPAIISTLVDITESKQAREVRRRREQEAQESLKMQQNLHEVSLVLSQTQTREELYRETIRLGHERLHFERFSMFIYNKDRDTFSGTFGIDLQGVLRDERGEQHEIRMPDIVAMFRDIKQRLLIAENSTLWDEGVQVGQGWHVTAPIRQGDELFGVLFTDNLISQRELPAYLPDLIASLSNIISNQITRQQAAATVQEALAESERLYEMSARLNATSTIEEIMEAAIVPIKAKGLASASLFTIDVDENGRPEWLELVASWARPDLVPASPAQGAFPVGSRFYLPNIPMSSRWIENPGEIGLFDDVPNNPSVDEVVRGMYAQGGVQAAANLALRTGNRWVGFMALTWSEIQNFTPDDARLLRTLTEQTAVILNNQLLLEESQKLVAELGTVAEVGVAITTIRNVDELLQQVVDLTKERFDLYHAHIYLLDSEENSLVLTNGAGEVGQRMVAEGRSIPLHQEQSLIARAARLRQGIIVNDVTTEPGFLPHALLPDTHAEMAVPIVVADKVLGVLDVQSDRAGRFRQEDIRIKTTLASQIGVALQNARSFARSEAARQELEEITRRLRREGWQSYMDVTFAEGMAYSYDQKEVASLDLSGLKRPQARKQKEENGATMLARPLLVQGEAIGNLLLEEPGSMVDDAADIVTAVAERLSAHIENLRLSEQTEQARQQAEQLYQGSAALNTAQTYADVLEALRQHTILGHPNANLCVIQYFDRPWTKEQAPEQVEILARWSIAPIDTLPWRYPLTALAGATALLQRDAPTLVEDLATDERMDDNIRAFFNSFLPAQSLIFAPLVIGTQWVGHIYAAYEKKVAFPEAEVRRLTTLDQQAAVNIQSIRLFAQAQARAERERQVRTITDKIRRGHDREAMLHIAREELSHLLGASKAMVRLGTENQLLITSENVEAAGSDGREQSGTD